MTKVHARFVSMRVTPTLLQDVADAKERRADAEQQFRAALVAAKRSHSWAEVARAAGVSKSGARWLVMPPEKKKRKKKA